MAGPRAWLGTEAAALEPLEVAVVGGASGIWRRRLWAGERAGALDVVVAAPPWSPPRMPWEVAAAGSGVGDVAAPAGPGSGAELLDAGSGGRHAARAPSRWCGASSVVGGEEEERGGGGKEGAGTGGCGGGRARLGFHAGGLEGTLLGSGDRGIFLGLEYSSS